MIGSEFFFFRVPIKGKMRCTVVLVNNFFFFLSFQLKCEFVIFYFSDDRF